MAAEGMFEYGSRCGVWRVLRAFEVAGVPATAFACALALERHPELAEAIKRSGMDVCCHGWRWEDHIAMAEDEERGAIARAVQSITATLGAPPSGWYCRTAPSVRTRQLLVEHGGFAYDSDAYNDDLPYWTKVSTTAAADRWHLVVPYTLCTNDSKFAPGRAFSTADDFFAFMRDSLEVLIAEAEATGRPKMMSVGLHPRLIGHPARIRGLQRFLELVAGNKSVWACQRNEIARHWQTVHPAPADPTEPPPGPPPLDAETAEADVDLSPLETSQPVMVPPARSSLVSPGWEIVAGQPQGARLLVTGGAGFVMSNLVHRWLSEDQEATAVVFDQARAWDDAVKAFLADFIADGRVAFYDGDVTSPSSWAELEAAYGAGFTHVVSAAAITPTDAEELRAPARILQVNLQGHLSCLEFARLRCTHLKRLVHVSSDAVLGVPDLLARGGPATEVGSGERAGARARTPGPLPATSTLPDMSLYACAKIAGEAATQRWCKLFGLDAVSVRFSDVYGRMDRDTGARNRHNAPFWLCRKVLTMEAKVCESQAASPLKPQRINVRTPAGVGLDGHCWDIIDAPSCARGICAILKAHRKPKRTLYHLALGRAPTLKEVISAATSSGAARWKVGRGIRKAGVRELCNFKQPSKRAAAAVTGTVDIESLPEGHWLLAHPMDVAPMKEEFGWEATPLPRALNEYLEHLRATAPPDAGET